MFTLRVGFFGHKFSLGQIIWGLSCCTKSLMICGPNESTSVLHSLWSLPCSKEHTFSTALMMSSCNTHSKTEYQTKMYNQHPQDMPFLLGKLPQATNWQSFTSVLFWVSSWSSFCVTASQSSQAVSSDTWKRGRRREIVRRMRWARENYFAQRNLLLSGDVTRTSLNAFLHNSSRLTFLPRRFLHGVTPKKTGVCCSTTMNSVRSWNGLWPI